MERDLVGSRKRTRAVARYSVSSGVQDDEGQVVDRRGFLHLAGLTAAGAAVAGCSEPSGDDEAAGSAGRGGTAAATAGTGDLPEIEWEMPTSWPQGLDALFGAAVDFADEVAALTGDRFRITPRAGGELVPALEVLPNVESGTYPIGHTASYYYTDRAEFTAFGTSLPFGLTVRQQNAWLYEAGGLDQLQQLYRDRFGMIQFPAGATGAQMGGWFNREIRSMADLQGLKMRIPGLGGRVMERLGVAVQQVPGDQILEALRTGALDAVEWVGPYDDLNLDLPSVARYYYYPGFWEPGPNIEVEVNARAYDDLPPLYQRVIQAAAFRSGVIMTARYDKRNAEALVAIERNPDVQILPYPDDVLLAGRDASFALYDELAARDADFRALFEPWNAHRQEAARWFSLAEASIINFSTRR